ncbi:hypothetical protein [Gimesia fumaroli]|jgi:hypothetical protein|uniref:Carboxypeptidase regulatory-like domain-containing protein n=1 Tax=Gimesia fumaroli TaxID=2527976 RepID=A0A518IFG7_9PLAN|nr:hypothetical protein [Gimesia fumaroli]QDV51841.1 hypothetical protein Enr17x_39000 [Gimesia fumaroli]
MNQTSIAVRALLMVLITSLSGCGSQKEYTGEKRFPITGTVSFKGEPVSSGMISLIPEDGNSNPAGGPIENGTFSIPEEKGPNKATYRVAVYWRKPTGKKVKDADTGEEIDQVKQVIPAKYNDATELSVVVAGNPEEDVLKLDLTE